MAVDRRATPPLVHARTRPADRQISSRIGPTIAFVAPRAGAQGAWRSFLAMPRPPCPRVAPEGLGRSGPTAGPKEPGAVLCGTGIDHLPSGWAIMDIREGTGARAWGGTGPHGVGQGSPARRGARARRK